MLESLNYENLTLADFGKLDVFLVVQVDENDDLCSFKILLSNAIYKNVVFAIEVVCNAILSKTRYLHIKKNIARIAKAVQVTIFQATYI